MQRSIGVVDSMVESGMWWDIILGKVCNSLSHFQNLTWGQIPQAAETKPCCSVQGHEWTGMFHFKWKMFTACWLSYLSKPFFSCISLTVCLMSAVIFSSCFPVPAMNCIFIYTLALVFFLVQVLKHQYFKPHFRLAN